jgi:hypothetical protein
MIIAVFALWERLGGAFLEAASDKLAALDSQGAFFAGALEHAKLRHGPFSFGLRG